MKNVVIFAMMLCSLGCTKEQPPEGEAVPSVVPVARAPALPQAPRASGKPRAAILYFDYDGTDADLTGLRKGLAQMLTSDTASDVRVEIVERARIQSILDELKLNESRVIDESTALKVGRVAGAEYLVLGGLFDVMGTMRIDARVVEVETSRVICSVGVNGVRDSFFDLEKKLGAGLVEILTSRGQECRPIPSAPPQTGPSEPRSRASFATAVFYSKALDAVDTKKPEEAKAILRAVVKESPDFITAALDLAALEK